MAMAEKVSISVNGESRVPPGFRFHPTEEELLQYYLRKKVGLEKIDLDVIVEVDLNKLEPWDIQERCKIGTTTPQDDWYLFSHKDKKYPSGSRTNRATMAGFWKATGRDKIIYGNGSSRIGMRKTLVFYKGRAPHGLKSEWIMHEYRLHDDNAATSKNLLTETTCQEEGWVVCRIFKKKSRGSSVSVSRASELMSSEEGSLEQIFLQQMGMGGAATDINPAGLPGLLELNPIISTVHVAASCRPCDHENNNYTFDATSNDNDNNSNNSGSDWAAMDRMLAAHLNGQQQPPDLSSSSSSHYNNHVGAPDCYYSPGSRGGREVDLWTLINR